MWNTEFHDISVKLEDHVVRIKSDPALKSWLLASPKNAHRLAAHIRHSYLETYEKELRITTRSLATEIFMHFLVQQIVMKKDRITEKMFHRRVLAKLSDSALLHTEVIDCGERFADGNRIVWDLLSFTKPEKNERPIDSDSYNA